MIEIQRETVPVGLIMLPQKTSMNRFISLFLSFALVATSVQWSDALQPTAFNLNPPSSLGFLIDRYSPAGPQDLLAPKVVLIQDLHAHYGVQKNIAGILEFLQKKLSSYATQSAPPFVLAVEGAQGPLDSSALAHFPKDPFKEPALDYLMRQGELTGMEYFAALEGHSHLLVGVEDQRLYELHRKLFRNTYSKRQRLIQALQSVQTDIRSLRRVYYSREMFQVQKRWEAYQAGRLSHETFVRKMMVLAKRFSISLTAQSAKSNDAYFQAKSITQKIKSGLSRKAHPKAQDLVRVEEDLDLLLHVVQLQATESDVEAFAPRLHEFLALAKSFLSSGAQAHLSVETEALLSSSIDFYVLAHLRNKPMVENTLALLHAPSKEIETAVLVAGGYHTAPMTQLLRQKKVSYVVIAPRVDSLDPKDQDLYVRRLNGEYLSESQIKSDLDTKSFLRRAGGGASQTSGWVGTLAVGFDHLKVIGRHMFVARLALMNRGSSGISSSSPMNSLLYWYLLSKGVRPSLARSWGLAGVFVESSLLSLAAWHLPILVFIPFLGGVIYAHLRLMKITGRRPRPILLRELWRQFAMILLYSFIPAIAYFSSGDQTSMIQAMIGFLSTHVAYDWLLSLPADPLRSRQDAEVVQLAQLKKLHINQLQQTYATFGDLDLLGARNLAWGRRLLGSLSNSSLFRRVRFHLRDAFKAQGLDLFAGAGGDEFETPLITGPSPEELQEILSQAIQGFTQSLRNRYLVFEAQDDTQRYHSAAKKTWLLKELQGIRNVSRVIEHGNTFRVLVKVGDDTTSIQTALLDHLKRLGSDGSWTVSAVSFESENLGLFSASIAAVSLKQVLDHLIKVTRRVNQTDEDVISEWFDLKGYLHPQKAEELLLWARRMANDAIQKPKITRNAAYVLPLGPLVDFIARAPTAEQVEAERRAIASERNAVDVDGDLVPLSQFSRLSRDFNHLTAVTVAGYHGRAEKRAFHLFQEAAGHSAGTALVRAVKAVVLGLLVRGQTAAGEVLVSRAPPDTFYIASDADLLRGPVDSHLLDREFQSATERSQSQYPDLANLKPKWVIFHVADDDVLRAREKDPSFPADKMAVMRILQAIPIEKYLELQGPLRGIVRQTRGISGDSDPLVIRLKPDLAKELLQEYRKAQDRLSDENRAALIRAAEMSAMMDQLSKGQVDPNMRAEQLYRLFGMKWETDFERENVKKFLLELLKTKPEKIQELLQHLLDIYNDPKISVERLLEANRAANQFSDELNNENIVFANSSMLATAQDLYERFARSSSDSSASVPLLSARNAASNQLRKLHTLFQGNLKIPGILERARAIDQEPLVDPLIAEASDRNRFIHRLIEQLPEAWEGDNAHVLSSILSELERHLSDSSKTLARRAVEEMNEARDLLDRKPLGLRSVHVSVQVFVHMAVYFLRNSSSRDSFSAETLDRFATALEQYNRFARAQKSLDFPLLDIPTIFSFAVSPFISQEDSLMNKQLELVRNMRHLPDPFRLPVIIFHEIQQAGHMDDSIFDRQVHDILLPILLDEIKRNPESVKMVPGLAIAVVLGVRSLSFRSSPDALSQLYASQADFIVPLIRELMEADRNSPVGVAEFFWNLGTEVAAVSLSRPIAEVMTHPHDSHYQADIRELRRQHMEMQRNFLRGDPGSLINNPNVVPSTPQTRADYYEEFLDILERLKGRNREKGAQAFGIGALLGFEGLKAGAAPFSTFEGISAAVALVLGILLFRMLEKSFGIQSRLSSISEPWLKAFATWRDSIVKRLSARKETRARATQLAALGAEALKGVSPEEEPGTAYFPQVQYPDSRTREEAEEHRLSLMSLRRIAAAA